MKPVLKLMFVAMLLFWARHAYASGSQILYCSPDLQGCEQMYMTQVQRCMSECPQGPPQQSFTVCVPSVACEDDSGNGAPAAYMTCNEEGDQCWNMPGGDCKQYCLQNFVEGYNWCLNSYCTYN